MCCRMDGQVASASGYFELEVVELQNPAGRLANGVCCGQTDGNQCITQCSTYFRLCLKEYQSNVTVSSPCTYGNTSSPVVAGNSFTFVEPGKSNARLVLPFTFRWTVSLTHLSLTNYHMKEAVSGKRTFRGSEARQVVFLILASPLFFSSPLHFFLSSLCLPFRVRNHFPTLVAPVAPYRPRYLLFGYLV